MTTGIGAIGTGIRMPTELGNAGRVASGYREAELGVAGNEATGPAGGLRMAEGSERTGFLDTAREFVDGVNELQQHADGQVRAFVRGEVELHDVAVATHEAAIAMRLTREIRDRLLGAYQEIMRTQM